MRNFLLILLLIGFAAINITGCDRPMTESMMDAVTPPEMPTTDDPEAFAVAFVQAAIDLYKSEGSMAIATYYNNPASINGQWYVFITDADDIFVAHAPLQGLVGTDLKDVMGLDGSALGEEIAKATETGLWIEYLWPNPQSGMDEMKRTWAIRYDGYLFASGYYKPAAEDTTPPMEDTTPPMEGSIPAGN